jgi:hypothetical protein
MGKPAEVNFKLNRNKESEGEDSKVERTILISG